MIDKSLRYYYNSNIVNKLSEFITKHPEMRFHQILWTLGIIDTDTDGTISDRFYEESEITWKKLINNRVFKNQSD